MTWLQELTQGAWDLLMLIIDSLVGFVDGASLGLRALFGACLLLVVLAGCSGMDPGLTDAQNQQATDTQMAWADKMIQVAEKHGIAYHLKLATTGRPSIGASTDLYLDTGLTAEIVFFGNGASAPQVE